MSELSSIAGWVSDFLGVLQKNLRRARPLQSVWIREEGSILRNRSVCQTARSIQHQNRKYSYSCGSELQTQYLKSQEHRAPGQGAFSPSCIFLNTNKILFPWPIPPSSLCFIHVERLFCIPWLVLTWQCFSESPGMGQTLWAHPSTYRFYHRVYRSPFPALSVVQFPRWTKGCDVSNASLQHQTLALAHASACWIHKHSWDNDPAPFRSKHVLTPWSHSQRLQSIL